MAGNTPKESGAPLVTVTTTCAYAKKHFTSGIFSKLCAINNRERREGHGEKARIPLQRSIFTGKKEN